MALEENLQPIHELEHVSIRLVRDVPFYSDSPIKKPEDAVKIVGDSICEYDREVLCVVNLQANGIPININIASMGSLNQTIAEPSQIFKSAVMSNANNILIMHNHPSGDLYPSEMDVMVTDRLMKAGDLMGIPLLDSIIVGGDNMKYYSFREHDILEYQKNRYTRSLMDIDFKQEIIKDIKKNGFQPTARLVDNIDALNEIVKEKKEIKTLKELKEYGDLLKQERQIYNAAIKECQLQEKALQLCR